jgi:hypothetical protein
MARDREKSWAFLRMIEKFEFSKRRHISRSVANSSAIRRASMV